MDETTKKLLEIAFAQAIKVSKKKGWNVSPFVWVGANGWLACLKENKQERFLYCVGTDRPVLDEKPPQNWSYFLSRCYQRVEARSGISWVRGP